MVVAYLKVPPLLATLGTLGAGLGMSLVLQKGVNTATYALDPVGHGHWIPGVPNLIPIGVLVVVLGFVLLHLAVFGRHTYAIGSNPESARRAGINVERHLLKVYVIGGVTAGFAGFLSVSYFSTTSIGGHSTDNLQAITAVALGGTSLFGGVGSIIGTLIGVWIPAILNNGLVITGSNRTGNRWPWASCSSPPSTSTTAPAVPRPRLNPMNGGPATTADPP